MTVSTSLRIPDEMNSRLMALAKETGRSKAFYILKAVDEYLDDLEDIYLADQVIEGIREGKVKIHSAKEVEERLGLGN